MSDPLTDAADAISTASPNIRAFAQLSAARTLALEERVTALEKPVPPPPPPPAPSKPIGFATGYPQGSGFMASGDLSTYIGRAKSLGANVLRYEVSGTDATNVARVNAVHAAGLQTVGIIPFDSSSVNYAAKAKSLAATFGPEVAWWELGNELNISGPRLTPAQYVPWHKAAATAILSVRPTAQVLTQGLSSWGQYGTLNTGEDMVRYMEECFAIDPHFGDYFHALACHPYYYNKDSTIGDLEDQAIVWSGIGAALSHAHNLAGVLDRFGYQSRGIFFTEVGVDTNETPWTGGVSETVQAAYYSYLVKLVQTTARLVGLCVYTVQDNAKVIATGTSREGSFGALHPDGSLKPSAVAFRTAVGA